MKHPAHGSRHSVVQPMPIAFTAHGRADARRTWIRRCRRSRAATVSLFRNGNTHAVSTRRYVTSLKHFIVSRSAARPSATARSVWMPASSFRASQYRRDALPAAAPRVNNAQQSVRGAGTESAFALQ
jgi:hypothetical protein